MQKLNKKSVIKTLQHNFELVLMNNLDSAKSIIKSNEGLTYFIFPQTKGL